MAKLSTAVRRLMKAKGWRADDLAEHAKIARSTVFSALADKSPDLETLRRLRKVGVRLPSIRDLLDNTTSTTSKAA